MDKYSQTTSELFDLQKFAIKLGLDNITKLSADLDNPHLKYPSIHIAGTNGKGSTAFYISKILQACGLKVGLFTSPHLIDFRERIRINGELIKKEYIIDFWDTVKKEVLNLKATFFDTTTLLAFKYFSDNKVDIAIFETGLGGRLDSTNIIEAEYVVLTPVSFDHQKQLGNNLRSIALEKAGIIKTGSRVYSAKQHPKVVNVFNANRKMKEFIYLNDHFVSNTKRANLDGLVFTITDRKINESYIFNLPTLASYQVDNFSLAFIVSKGYCKNNDLSFPMEKVRSSIEKANWPGRLQLIQKNPHIFFDVSHNLSGIKKTIKTLSKLFNPQQTDLLLGIVNDKDANSITKFLSGRFRNITITEPETTRKQDGEVLFKMFKIQKQNVKFIKDLSTAFEVSKNNLKKDDTLIALGSHYLIGALMRSG